MRHHKPALILFFMCLISLCGSSPTAGDKTREREIFINIHSGITTIPIRKVIGAVIGRAEKKGVSLITASGRLHKDGAWRLNLSFLDEVGNVKKSLEWRYVRDKKELTPLNEAARRFSFPLSGFIFSTAINMGLSMLEDEGVSPTEVNGRADKLPDGRWQFNMTGISQDGERFAQRWLYNSGALYIAQFDHSDLDRLLARAVTNGKIDYTVVKDTPHLKRFLKKVAKLDEDVLDAFPREEQLAFWINAHNAIMLWVMADNLPEMDPESIARTIEQKRFKVAGNKLTLAQMRDDILRDTFSDDRVEFAMLSTFANPHGLRGEAYCGRLLDAQLDEAARDFLK